MHGHYTGTASNLPKIAVIGNPNVGKSVVFGLLSGRYATVSNYPGTTVEVVRAIRTLNKNKYELIDTPGINNLVPMSEDERVTRDILLNEKVELVLQIADAKNLRRALLISLQLAEMRLPFVLDLNMIDESRERRISINAGKLSQILGVEAVPTVAVQKYGLEQLIRSLSEPRLSTYRMSYDETIEAAIGKLEGFLPSAAISKRSLALMLLAGDASLRGWLLERIDEKILAEIEKIINEVRSKYNESMGYVITQQRLRAAEEILKQVLRAEEVSKGTVTEKLGNLTMHPFWGLPVLLFVLYLMYKFVGEFGAGTLVDFFENTIFGKYLNPFAIRLAGTIPIKLLQELLVGEYGLITTALTYALAIVLPIVGTFFIFFGFLEDTGYLPRLAIMSNRAFKSIGLNGKAVLPMVLGLGCDTMATMTARILETKKDRIIVTLLLALAVPCSAQLGVILGMLSTLSAKAAYIWAGMVILVMLLVGYLASKVIPGEPSDFILEIPPLRIPKASNIAVKTLARVEWYVKEAVPLFILGTFLLFVFDRIGLLKIIEIAASPVVVSFLGLPAKATEAFIVGFLRRDYGAAGLFVLAEKGLLDPTQIVVSLVTITLFVPCIANFFMMVKERGLKTALAIAAFIFPFAFLVGGILNFLLRYFEVVL
ncbi:MAG: ferrous iron transport protein B [Euryarchaeota archaeon]|nr:ferrous iron transport protein B [Euryarchaeota archaeon]